MFRLKKMHLLVLRSFGGPLLAGFAISLFLLVLAPMIRMQEQLFSKGFSLEVILQFLGYVALTQVVEALALGILLSSLMTMGKMGEQYELAALKASGISLWRVLRPLLMTGAVLFIGALTFSFYIRPWANLKMYTLMYDIKQAKPSFALKPGMFNTLIDGYTIRAANREGDLLKEVHIYDHSKNVGANKVIVADSGRMEIDNQMLFLRMELYHGEQYEELPSGSETGRGYYPFARISFDTLNYKLDLSSWGLKRTDETLFSNHQYMHNIQQLVHNNDSVVLSRPEIERRQVTHLQENLHLPRWVGDSLVAIAAAAPALDSSTVAAALDQPKAELMTTSVDLLRSLSNYMVYQRDNLNHQTNEFRRFNRELHSRITLPLAVLLFLVIGTSLGAIIRKGGLGAPVLAAIVLFAVFYVLLSSGRNMAQEGVLPVWLAMWMPIFVMLPLAVFLAYQSATDSGLLDLSAWKLLIGRWRRKLKGGPAAA